LQGKELSKYEYIKEAIYDYLDADHALYSDGIYCWDILCFDCIIAFMGNFNDIPDGTDACDRSECVTQDERLTLYAFILTMPEDIAESIII
jgi:hypothetical protein